MAPPHTRTSRLAPTAYLGPSRVVDICTPTALGAPSAPAVNNTRSVWAHTAIVRLGLSRTSCRRYVVAVELPGDWRDSIRLAQRVRKIRLTLMGSINSAEECPSSSSSFCGVEVPELPSTELNVWFPDI